MNESYPLITGGVVSHTDFTEFEFSEPVFSMHNNNFLHMKEVNPSMLNFLVASVLRKPRDLFIHLQRIALCYELKNEEKLYAALVDFFVVLQNIGLSIKKRMLAGSRSELSPLLMQRLQDFLLQD